MLVFFSDIHFSDGTSGPSNVPASAFAGAYEHIEDMAKKAGAERLEIVFLGDVFDMIRTNGWQRFPEQNRPWGQKEGIWTAGQDDASLQLLQDIATLNAGALQVLRSDPHLHTTRVYVPGNHDRLTNQSEALRTETARILGLSSTGRFCPHYWNQGARTFARHGHEFDGFNFEGAQLLKPDRWTDLPDSAYDATPIGDLLAAEISARLPEAVLKRLADGAESHPELAIRLRDLFDVRPTAAMLSFLKFQIQNFDDPAVTDAINEGLHEVFVDFEKLSYIQDWIRKHDKPFHPLDSADKMQLAIFFGQRISLTKLEGVVRLFDHLTQGENDDNLASSAAADFRRLDSHREFGQAQPEFILYGHTHKCDQRLIGFTSGKGSEARPRMYLNTGMWRPLHNEGVGGGFSSWENLSYTVIYEPGEQWKGGLACERPMFEVWQGALGR